MSWIFLVFSIVGAWFTYNAFRPTYAPASRATLSFVAGWLTSELALHHIALQALVTLGFFRAGALHGFVGRLGVAITVLSWIGLALCYARSRAARDAVEQALLQGLGADYRDRILAEIDAKLPADVDWRRIFMPLPMRRPDVERVRNIPYRRAAGLNLKLDVYRHRSRPSGCPVLLEVHGGAWVFGSKNEQGIPLMLRLASRGWVCASVNYRLSPHATFPDFLVDLKDAIRWIREHGPEYGADPDFLVVTGQSAGGHLASLVALTANDPEYQPGFENADTRVSGCVSCYGVYDFTDRFGFWRNDGLARLVEERVIKASLQENREAYEKASPMSRIHADAPPFFAVHGDLDTLVPVAEARRFCELLRSASGAPVVYAEIPGAQHAFEIFPSLRAELVWNGIERFLGYLYSQYLAARRAAVLEAFRTAAS